jgi:hypothetical protein
VFKDLTDATFNEMRLIGVTVSAKPHPFSDAAATFNLEHQHGLGGYRRILGSVTVPEGGAASMYSPKGIRFSEGDETFEFDQLPHFANHEELGDHELEFDAGNGVSVFAGVYEGKAYVNVERAEA